MHPRVDRGAGGEEAGSGGGGVRRGVAELWGTQPSIESACALSEGTGNGAGRASGIVCGARHGDDGGPAGGAEGGRGLRAVGPDVSGGAAAGHAGRQRAGGAADARASARVVRGPRAQHSGYRSRTDKPLGESGGKESRSDRGFYSAGSGVRDLHVGIVGSAQGGGRGAPECSESAELDAERLSTESGRGGAAKRADRV